MCVCVRFCLILEGMVQFSYILASSYAISYFEDLLSVEIKEDWIIASVYNARVRGPCQRNFCLI